MYSQEIRVAVSTHFPQFSGPYSQSIAIFFYLKISHIFHITVNGTMSSLVNTISQINGLTGLRSKGFGHKKPLARIGLAIHTFAPLSVNGPRELISTV